MPRSHYLLLAALVLLLGSLAQAQAQIVALWPLDSRPVTSAWPGLLGRAAGMDLRLPPTNWLGTATTGASADQLEAWLDETKPDLVIVSLDSLAYGGLVQSRQAGPSLEDAWARLQPLRDWRKRSGVRVWAFVVIPRQPEARDAPRNLALIDRALDLAGDGTFERLVVGWDDALGSPAPAQGAAVRAAAETRGLKNVAVYAGADEIASTLVARAALAGARVTPSVALITDDPAAAGRVLPYDGQPLAATFAAQAGAVGFTASDDAPDRVTLFVRTSLNARDAALRVLDLQRRGPTALVDLEKVNTFNWTWLEALRVTGAVPTLAGLAGWGTPGNNVGWALAEAAVSLVAPSDALAPLLALGYVNDGLYSSVLRPELRAEGWLTSVSDVRTEAGNGELLQRVQAALPRSGLAAGQDVRVTAASFPWARTFEVSVTVSVEPPRPGPWQSRLAP